MIYPYVYVIVNCYTGSFYIGSRYANVREGFTPEEDLWKRYKSSSDVLKSEIAIYGEDAFIYEVIFTHDDFASGENDFTVYWHEQDLIKEHRKNPLCLNGHYQDRETSKIGYCVAGKPKSLEHREKIGIPQKGVPKKPESIA
ncbi:hypothetical protein, partial [Acinetobacter sp.]|uniref:hypothetical protein n=1 Tax=Acinetobacter sp. TaxID=472 RepID=UPI00388F8F05